MDGDIIIASVSVLLINGKIEFRYMWPTSLRTCEWHSERQFNLEHGCSIAYRQHTKYTEAMCWCFLCWHMLCLGASCLDITRWCTSSVTAHSRSIYFIRFSGVETRKIRHERIHYIEIRPSHCRSHSNYINSLSASAISHTIPHYMGVLRLWSGLATWPRPSSPTNPATHIQFFILP